LLEAQGNPITVNKIKECAAKHSFCGASFSCRYRHR